MEISGHSDIRIATLSGVMQEAAKIVAAFGDKSDGPATFGHHFGRQVGEHNRLKPKIP
jgi:hypothetical protein